MGYCGYLYVQSMYLCVSLFQTHPKMIPAIFPANMAKMRGYAEAAATDRRTADHALLCADLTGLGKASSGDIVSYVYIYIHM